MPKPLSRPSTPPSRDAVAARLRAAPFSKIVACWDEIDARGTDEEGIRTLCLIDRYYLLVKVLNRTDVWHPWLYDRCREVEKDPDGYLDIWARDHYKSTLITFAGIIQEVLNDPELTVGIFSHTRPLATAFLVQIKRELEGNDDLKALFPHILWSNPSQQAPAWGVDVGLVVRRESNPKEATIEAHGLVDGQPTSRHYRLRVYDDVVNESSVSTPEQTIKTTSAVSLSDNLGTADGRVWWVGTRYSFADTYQHLIDHRIAHLRLRPATDDGTRDGHPVLLSEEAWERKKRTQLEKDIACQLLGNPLSGTQRWFDPDDLQDYEARSEVLAVFMMVDPARSKKKSSANTAMAVLGIDELGRKFLLDGFDHKMNLQERWQNMRDLWAHWRVQPGVISIKVGYERFGAQADLDYFEERIRIESVQVLTIEILEWPNEGEGSKDDRVQRLLPDLASHNIYLPHEPKEGDPDLTPTQQRMIEAGYEYRIARPIVKRDENRQLYNLAERFRMQVAFYPFTTLKDLIDAVSRIYDLDPRPPEFIDSTILEPEVT